ncbi:MAG: hypothetical protein LC798_13415, partial [Chloroflexi bacterium]|nr:hypothetical protein [Chloroflexota bacterium]
MIMLRLLGVALAVSLAIAPATAFAAPDLLVTPTLPLTVVVGQSGLPGDVLLTNENTPPDGSLTICDAGDPLPCPAGGEGITVLPSCGTPVPSCATFDADVFALGPNAVGRAGTACAGIPFTVTRLAGASGRYRFDPPPGVNVVLPTPGSTCRIAFTFDVLRLPTLDADSATNGLQTAAVAAAFARSDQVGNTASSRASRTVTVLAGPPAAAAPPAPLLTRSDPGSPAGDNTPQLRGNAATGSTVRIYANPTCTGDPAGQGSAATFASTGIAVSVADNTTTTFYATATNATGTSPCSQISLTYVEDSAAPAVPMVTGTDPTANDNSPQVRGSAAAGTTVLIFTNAACSGQPVAVGSAETFLAPGITVTVADNTATMFYAAASDGANRSACSTTFATYTEDSAPPQTTIDSGPSGTVASGTAVQFTFSAGQAGSTFECRLGTAGFAPCTSPATYASPPPGVETRFEVRAIDPSHNTDPTPATRTFT